jgi:hypothetical protein
MADRQVRGDCQEHLETRGAIRDKLDVYVGLEHKK